MILKASCQTNASSTIQDLSLSLSLSLLCLSLLIANWALRQVVHQFSIHLIQKARADQRCRANAGFCVMSHVIELHVT